MNIKETKALYKGEFTAVEVYKFTDKSHSIHTDFIRELNPKEYNDDSEVATHQLMNEDDYNNTIFANCGNRFTDIYDKYDKVLVIVVKEDLKEIKQRLPLMKILPCLNNEENQPQRG